MKAQFSVMTGIIIAIIALGAVGFGVFLKVQQSADFVKNLGVKCDHPEYNVSKYISEMDRSVNVLQDYAYALQLDKDLLRCYNDGVISEMDFQFYLKGKHFSGRDLEDIYLAQILKLTDDGLVDEAKALKEEYLKRFPSGRYADRFGTAFNKFAQTEDEVDTGTVMGKTSFFEQAKVRLERIDYLYSLGKLSDMQDEVSKILSDALNTFFFTPPVLPQGCTMVTCMAIRDVNDPQLRDMADIIMSLFPKYLQMYADLSKRALEMDSLGSVQKDNDINSKFRMIICGNSEMRCDAYQAVVNRFAPPETESTGDLEPCPEPMGVQPASAGKCVCSFGPDSKVTNPDGSVGKIVDPSSSDVSDHYCNDCLKTLCYSFGDADSCNQFSETCAEKFNTEEHLKYYSAENVQKFSCIWADKFDDQTLNGCYSAGNKCVYEGSDKACQPTVNNAGQSEYKTVGYIDTNLLFSDTMCIPSSLDYSKNPLPHNTALLRCTAADIKT